MNIYNFNIGNINNYCLSRQKSNLLKDSVPCYFLSLKTKTAHMPNRNQWTEIDLGCVNVLTALPWAHNHAIWAHRGGARARALVPEAT